MARRYSSVTQHQQHGWRNGSGRAGTRPHRTGPGVIALMGLVLLAGLTGALALDERQVVSRFDAIAIADPSVVVSPESMGADSPGVPEPIRNGWTAFRASYGEMWEVYLDARSGAPLLVQGQGIPFIPSGGDSWQPDVPVTVENLAAELRAFVNKTAPLLVADPDELVLNLGGSAQITPDLWQIVFDREVSGVPVSGDRYVFYVGYGNLVAFGASRWSEIKRDPNPGVSPADAFRKLSFYMGLTPADIVTFHNPGSLKYVPMTSSGSTPLQFDGTMGSGYDAALAWEIVLEVEGEQGLWTALVDADNGKVLALYDAIFYAQAKGGIFPLSNDGSCPDGCEQPNFSMPFADIHIGAANSTASSMGMFTCQPNGSTATTNLAGPYVRVSDTCGAISRSVTCDADLDLGVSAGTDCAVPPGGSAGNTHASRSTFHHLNRIREHAKAWMPTTPWLDQQLTNNVNIALTCNAFWSPSAGTVNFYRSGGGCRNTGEIAAVVLHEWGHGLDQNDGGGFDNTSEAYADITSFLLTHKSCIGRGFRSINCTGPGGTCLNCTGVRDQDWDQRSNHAPTTPELVLSACGSGGGPCGRQVHCEGHITGEALWDLAVRDLPAAGIDQQTAWQMVDRLWFRSRIGSGGNAYSCGSPASTRSCAATSWFNKLRVIDDDDGNLANGTPHAAAIFAAFNRHNIPCGASTDAANQNTSSCPALAAPTLTVTPANNSVYLSWTPVTGAASYVVLRNDQGCGWGFSIIATVTGTSYTDTNLPNGFPLNYSVQAVGANSACTGVTSTCRNVQAGGPHAIYQSNATVDDTCIFGGLGDEDGIIDPGESVQFSVSIRNDGTVTLTGLTVTVTSTTPGVTVLDGTASLANLAPGATGITLDPHITVKLPDNLTCGSTIGYNLTITSAQGSWPGSFTQTVGNTSGPCTMRPCLAARYYPETTITSHLVSGFGPCMGSGMICHTIRDEELLARPPSVDIVMQGGGWSGNCTQMGWRCPQEQVDVYINDPSLNWPAWCLIDGEGYSLLSSNRYDFRGVSVVGCTPLPFGFDYQYLCRSDTDCAAGHRCTVLTGRCHPPVLSPMTLDAGYGHSISSRADGTVWAWGMNSDGQIGDGSTTNRSAPVRAGTLTGMIEVGAGVRHSIALKNDGTVWTWGDNDYGQLGDGTTTQRLVPGIVPGLTGIVAIASGINHNLALKNDGTVWAWGYNWAGMLGDGTTINRLSPIQVPGISGVTAVSAAYFHSVALKSDGTVWIWGRNAEGELGNGSHTDRYVPGPVPGLGGVVRISGNGYFTLVIMQDGTMKGWGHNFFGQLGDASNTERTTPVNVTGLTNVVNISAGAAFSLAVKGDGTVWSWGQNVEGQIGDGTLTHRNTPGQVLGVSGIFDIAGGEDHSLARNSTGILLGWGENIFTQIGSGLPRELRPFFIIDETP